MAITELRVRLLAHDGQVQRANRVLKDAITAMIAVGGENTLDVMRLQALLVQILRTVEPPQALQAQTLAISIRTKLSALHLQPAWLEDLAL